MIKLRTACLVATMVVATTTFASAQGGMTDRNGNSMGSQHVGNGGGAMSSPTGTTGMNTRRSGRDSPNGSPGAAPKAHGGPAHGDASQKEMAPH